MTQWEWRKGDKKTVLMSSKALIFYLSDRFLYYLVETVVFIAIWLSVFTSLFISIWLVQSKMFESMTFFYFYSDIVSLQKYYSKVPVYLLWLQNKIFAVNSTFSVAGILVAHWKYLSVYCNGEELQSWSQNVWEDGADSLYVFELYCS